MKIQAAIGSMRNSAQQDGFGAPPAPALVISFSEAELRQIIMGHLSAKGVMIAGGGPAQLVLVAGPQGYSLTLTLDPASWVITDGPPDREC
jgi:hypothetical protein